MDAYDVLWFFSLLSRPFRVRRDRHEIVRATPETAAVPRFMQILNESLEIMKNTTNPGTLFSRYDTAVDMAERILETSFVDAHITYAEEVLDCLLSERDAIAIDFVNRCNAKGNLRFVKDAILENDTVFSVEAKIYLLEVLEQGDQS